MIVLDTNVLSELIRPTPEPSVIRWVNERPADTVYTTAVTVFELRLGIARMPVGKRRDGLELALGQLVATVIAGRTLAFDTKAANAAATIVARASAAGRPIDTRDAFIAGVVAAHGAKLVTRNARHFADAGIPLINPWTEAV